MQYSFNNLVFNKQSPSKPHHSKSPSLVTVSRTVTANPSRSPRKIHIEQIESVEEEEEIDINAEEKPKLSDIIFKHRNQLKLKTVANLVKENARKTNKLNPERLTTSTQATDEGGHEETEQKFNEQNWKKITAMVKDVLIIVFL